MEHLNWDVLIFVRINLYISFVIQAKSRLLFSCLLYTTELFDYTVYEFFILLVSICRVLLCLQFCSLSCFCL